MKANCERDHSYFRWTADLVCGAGARRMKGWVRIGRLRPGTQSDGEKDDHAERWSAGIEVVVFRFGHSTNLSGSNTIRMCNQAVRAKG
jgi:hypothetical protein